jgi:LacI family transcriptional regulator
MPEGASLGPVLDLPDPATAVFTANAVASIAAVRALHGRGRTDVAMVSFDDFPVADSLTPAISVADQDPVIMGRHAFEALKARIEGDTSPPRQILVPMHFVARGSGELAPLVPAAEPARRASSPRKPAVRGRRLVIPPPQTTGESHV